MMTITEFFFSFNWSGNPFIGLTIVILSFYVTYYLFHKKRILKQFYHENPEDPRNDKKYYAIVSISTIAILFIINLIATILSLTWLFVMFLDWLATYFENKGD